MHQMLACFLQGLKARMPGENSDDHVAGLHRGIASKAGEILARLGKPLAMVLVAINSDPDQFRLEYDRAVARKLYTSQGIPCFDTGREAFSVLRRVADYYSRRGRAPDFEQGLGPMSGSGFQGNDVTD